MSPLPALYEIAQQYCELQALADIEELPAELIRDTIEGLEGDLTEKSANIAKLIEGLEAEAQMIAEAAHKIRERAERRQRRADRIRAYLLFQLQRAGINKIDCAEFSIAVRKNPEAVEFSDLESLPKAYMVQPAPPPPHPDKRRIKEDLKAGKCVPGAYLVRGERLEIKS
jgi:hypothetical protein